MADFPGTVGDDLIDGTATADTISDGGGGNDMLNGGDGDDVITTTGGNDIIDGGNGTDRLVLNVGALPGNTLVQMAGGTGTFVSPDAGSSIDWSGIENITYNGGTGTDGVTLLSGIHIVDLGGAGDSLSVADGTITANGGPNNDSIGFENASAGVSYNSSSGVVSGASLSGSAVNFERAIGSAFDDFFVAGTSTTLLSGSNGDDVLDSGTSSGSLILNGGAGNDIYVLRNGSNVTLPTTMGNGAGIDRVETDMASYTLPVFTENLEYFGSAAFSGTGNSLANIIVGGAMGDTLSGLGDNDTLGGEGGNDLLDGGDGNDRLNGGVGADTLDGGAGNDILVVDNAGDVANGGDGIDTLQIVTAGLTLTIAADIEIVSVSSGSAVVTLNALDNSFGGSTANNVVFTGLGADVAYGRAGNDSLFGDGGDDRLFGEAGADGLTGGSGSDLLYGGADNDGLNGDDDNDTLYGEAGDDVLNGGSGIDQLFGGAGADRFQFFFGQTGATAATADRIRDFSQAQGDRIDLSGFDATNEPGLGGFIYVGSAAFSNVAGQLRFEIVGGNTFVQGDRNGDGVADVFIRIDGVHALVAGDFIL